MNSIVPAPLNAYMRGEQPLTESQRELMDSVYALFDEFTRGNRSAQDGIRTARKIRTLEDPVAGVGPARHPQLNTLNSTIDNMVADYVDNTPEAIMEPETAEMNARATDMTDVIGWVLHHGGFDKAWRQAVEDAPVTGTAVLHPVWDVDMQYADDDGGVSIERLLPEQWFPDPLSPDFQEGRAVFKAFTYPLSWFVQHYPDEAQYIDPDADSTLGANRTDNEEARQYADPQVALLECWFRRYDAKTGRYTIHMVKVAGRTLLYDSRDKHPDGVYAHGKYPFVTLRFRECPDSAYGEGMIHLFGDTQRMINFAMRCIDDNVRAAAKPKVVANRNADVDMDALTDYDKQVVLANTTGPEAFQWQQARPLNSQAAWMVQWLMDGQKQDSGQNQFARGEGGLGVTAASAIMALQEAGGKITRLHTAAFMDSFREMVEQVISLVAQFVTSERIVMITGNDSGMEPRGVAYDGAMFRGGRGRNIFERPAVTVRVQVQRSAPNQVAARNQLITEAANICAQSQMPVPPGILFRALIGYSGKSDVVKMIDAADTQRVMLEQLAVENEQLKAGLDAASQENAAMRQMLAQEAPQPIDYGGLNEKLAG